MSDVLMVTIPAKEYFKLLEDRHFLECLSNNGVDNWEWYDTAVEEFNKEE